MTYIPKTAIVIGVLATLAGVDAPAQAQGSGVHWSLSVTDVLGQHDLVVSRGGGRLPSTGLDQCEQKAVRDFRDTDGDLQEEVRVTCNLLTSKVTLIQSCFVSQTDRSFGAMRVDSVSPYTIALQCATR